jgi:hypothetical protein
MTHHVLVSAHTFGAPVAHDERIVFDQNTDAAAMFTERARRTLEALEDSRYSQRSEQHYVRDSTIRTKSRLPVLLPKDADRPRIIVDLRDEDGRSPVHDLMPGVSSLLTQGIARGRNVVFGDEHLGLDPHVIRTCLQHVARAISDGRISQQEAAEWDFAVDLATAWTPPMIRIMSGYVVIRSIPTRGMTARSVTFLVDAMCGSDGNDQEWTIEPTRIRFVGDQKPDALEILRLLKEADDEGTFDDPANGGGT